MSEHPQHSPELELRTYSVEIVKDRLSEQDAQALRLVATKAYENVSGLDPLAIREAVRPNDPHMIARYIEQQYAGLVDGSQTHVVARDNAKQPIGEALITRNVEGGNRIPYDSQLEDFHILPKMQGQGIGNKLLLTALEAAHPSNILPREELTTKLDVIKDSVAEQMYKQLGYQPTGVTYEDPIYPNGPPVTKIEYAGNVEQIIKALQQKIKKPKSAR